MRDATLLYLLTVGGTWSVDAGSWREASESPSRGRPLIAQDQGTRTFYEPDHVVQELGSHRSVHDPMITGQ